MDLYLVWGRIVTHKGVWVLALLYTFRILQISILNIIINASLKKSIKNMNYEF